MALHCQKLLASMHDSLGQRKPAIDVRSTMLRDALWGREDRDLDEAHAGEQLDDSIAFYLEQLRSLRCGYASTAEDDYTWHLEQNMEYLEEIVGRVKGLMKDCEMNHETGDVLDLGAWKVMDRSDIGDDALDAWCAPKGWRVEMEIEEDGWDSAWSATDI